MVQINAFRIIADVSHTVSKCILIWAIHSNMSAEGVSLITQILYTAVFCGRYLDLLWTHPFEADVHAFLNLWNFFLKIFYISSSAYTIFIMMKWYPRTHERNKAWKFGIACFVVSLLSAPLIMLWFSNRLMWSFIEFLWTFSEILESVCVLPQLLLLRQTTVPTVIDSFYLVTLGSYRAFYILNWIVRRVSGEHPHTTQVVFGTIQTALYLDFAWVYWTRQRVKLRNGALVDSDDFRRGWLVSRLLGKVDAEPEDDSTRAEGGLADPVAPRRVGSKGGWGARGISISADEDVPGGQQDHPSSKTKSRPAHTDAATRPEEVEGMLDGNDGDSDIDDALPSSDTSKAVPKGVGNGSEWSHEDDR